MKIFFEVF